MSDLIPENDFLTDEDSDETPPVVYPPAEERFGRAMGGRDSQLSHQLFDSGEFQEKSVIPHDVNDFEIAELERLQAQLDAARAELERVYADQPVHVQSALDKLKEILDGG